MDIYGALEYFTDGTILFYIVHGRAAWPGLSLPLIVLKALYIDRQMTTPDNKTGMMN